LITPASSVSQKTPPHRLSRIIQLLDKHAFDAVKAFALKWRPLFKIRRLRKTVAQPKERIPSVT